MFLKKTLGQHFLRDPKILGKIVAAANLSPEDTVLEVGPGEGTLTKLLLEQAGKVIAVEKDDRLIPMLGITFEKEIASGKLQLIHGDILNLDVKGQWSMVNSWKVVANLPYYITGEFLRKFLSGAEQQPSSMTLMLQKEVARRIVANDGFESILSISVKVYGTPEYVDTVKAGSFVPAPNVDSAILHVKHISKDFFKEVTEEKFFEMLKRGFAHPRKLLSSNLGIRQEALEACSIPAQARAETLSLDDWRRLSKQFTESSRSQG